MTPDELAATVDRTSVLAVALQLDADPARPPTERGRLTRSTFAAGGVYVGAAAGGAGVRYHFRPLRRPT